MSDIEITKYDPKDITLDRKMYEHAINKGMNFSQYLTSITNTGPGDKLDGFEKQLERYGVRLHDDPEAGIQATKVDYFFQSNAAPTTILFPEVINRMARIALLDEVDILSELVARMDTIDNSGVLRSIYIDDTEAQRQMGRVPEMGEFPTTILTWSEKATTLKKFGIRIKASYEFMRRVSMPLLQTLIGRIALQSRKDEVDLAMTALQSGENDISATSPHASGGAISHIHLVSLQGGSPTLTSDMTLASYLAWLATFYPGQCTTIIGTATDIYQAWMLASPSTIPFWINNLVNRDAVPAQPIIVNTKLAPNIRYVEYSGCTAAELIGIDKRYAMIGYREVGTDLTETDKIINGQWNEVVISNTIGFQMIFAAARKQLKMAGS
jgi:hypothetical protein